MKNNKTPKIQIIHILILFIIINLATFNTITVKSSFSEQLTTTQNEPYISSHIKLTTKHIPLLTQTQIHIKDIQIKKFIKLIINEIVQKNSVDQHDLRTIIKQEHLETEIKGIYYLCFLRSDGIGYLIARGMLPLLFMIIFQDFIMEDAYIGPTAYVEWDSPKADTKINLRKLYDDDRQSGYAFGFIGITYTGGIWPVIYSILGFSLIVIITDYEY